MKAEIISRSPYRAIRIGTMLWWYYDGWWLYGTRKRAHPKLARWLETFFGGAR